jgi:flagellar basal body rod protein FlgG
LANSQTAGFRRRIPIFQGFGAELQAAGQKLNPGPAIALGTKIREAALDMRPGVQIETGRALDVAMVEKNAFFTVETPFGIRLTRSGRLQVTKDNELVNQEGFPVIDGTTKQPIKLEAEKLANATGATAEAGGAAEKKGKALGEVSIRENGDVYAGANRLGSLNLIRVPPENFGQLIAGGGDLFLYEGPAEEAAKVTVKSGVLESSNVRVESEMIQIILNVRSTELAAEALRIQDEGLGKALQDLAG